MPPASKDGFFKRGALHPVFRSGLAILFITLNKLFPFCHDFRTVTRLNPSPYSRYTPSLIAVPVCRSVAQKDGQMLSGRSGQLKKVMHSLGEGV